MPADNRKEITGRIDPELWEELHEQTHKRRVSKNEAIVAGLKSWLYGPAQPTPARTSAKGEHSSTPQNQGVILERLDILLEGQRNIQDGVTKVLREIAKVEPNEPPIESEPRIAHELKDERSPVDREAQARATKFIEAHGGKPKLTPAAKKDRPRKQVKAAGDDPRRSGS